MTHNFISFEGVDGAGKSSHISWMSDLLRARGSSVVVTREPGGTDLGEKLRGLLLSEQMDIDTELLLMFAARRQHLAEVIEPALARGDVVITDRFCDSTYAYQGGGRNVAYERISILDEWVGGVRPSLTFFFDIPVEVAMQRLAGTRELDRFEREGRSFHEAVREAYRYRAQIDPNRVVVIDANRSIEAIRSDLQKAVA